MLWDAFKKRLPWEERPMTFEQRIAAINDIAHYMHDRDLKACVESLDDLEYQDLAVLALDDISAFC